jgi:hypothetical protein
MVNNKKNKKKSGAKRRGSNNNNNNNGSSSSVPPSTPLVQDTNPLAFFNSMKTTQKRETFKKNVIEVSTNDQQALVQTEELFDLHEAQKGTIDLLTGVMATQASKADTVCKHVDWSGVIFLRTIGELYSAITCTHLKPDKIKKAQVIDYEFESCMLMNKHDKILPTTMLVKAQYNGFKKKEVIRLKVSNFNRDINGTITIWSPVLRQWPYPYFLTGPWSGGSRDLSVTVPVTTFKPVRSTGLMGRYNIDMPQNWEPYAGNIGDDLHDLVDRVKTMVGGERGSHRNPDVYDLQYVCFLQDMSVMVPSTPDRTCGQKKTIPFSGSNTSYIHKSIKLQTSYWTLFHSEFFYLLNKLAQDAVILYPLELGYVHTVTADGSFQLFDSEAFIKSRKDKDATLCRYVRQLAAILKKMVVTISTKMTSLGRPGFMAHYLYNSCACMAEFLQEGKYC